MSAIEQIEIEQLKEELKDARESISWWNRRYNALNKCNNEKKDRIYKAIKHIETHQLCYQSQYEEMSGFDNHLLDILKGENNE